ncbi:MAG TPA: hypothetical protein DCK87_02605 [Desulfotomaculum sp.]|nr:hypothetical protein [Desulfotomaculum sp.]
MRKETLIKQINSLLTRTDIPKNKAAHTRRKNLLRQKLAMLAVVQAWQVDRLYRSCKKEERGGKE